MSVTVYDKLAIFPLVPLLLANATYGAITGVFRGSEGAPTYTQHVGAALLRAYTYHARVQTVWWLTPPFVETYKSWCSKNKVVPDVVGIPNTTTEAKGFWLGNKSTAKYKMVYYHGGGFVYPGTPQHFEMLLKFIKYAKDNLAIFCVCYTLSPTVTYPVALSEGVEGLRYVLDQPGNSPSNTLLGGDSAGGNLVLAILSHVSGHPHPRTDMVKPLNLSGDLKAAMVIAPWTSTDSKRYSSFQKNANLDMIGVDCLQRWIGFYKGPNASDDEYICAALASADWWKGVKCDEMLATAGEDEVLLGPVTDWAEKYAQGAGAGKIKYVIGLREFHDRPLNFLPPDDIDKLGEKTQEGAIKLWLQEKLK